MELNALSFHILGMVPATKGSYRAMHAKSGDVHLVPMSKKEKPWREFVASHIRAHYKGPQIKRNTMVKLYEVFYLPRPRTVSYRRRVRPTVPPDIDKLQRALHDALVDSGLLEDDSSICIVTAEKRYVADLEECGVYVQLTQEDNHA